MLLKSGAGVLAGFASPAKRLSLGASGVAAAWSVGFTLLKKLGVAGVGSCGFGDSCVWPKLNLGVLALVDVWRAEKRLLAGAGAGVLALANMFVDVVSAGFGVLAPPNTFVDVVSAGFGVLAPANIFVVAASAGFGVAAAPKLKRDGVAGAGAFVLSAAWAPVAPKPNMFFCGVAVFCEPSLFCASAPAPKPPKAGAAAGALFCAGPPKLKMLDVGAGVLVLAGAAEAVAPNWKDGVLAAAGVDVLFAPSVVVLFPPKLNVGCEAGAGVLGAAADELAPNEKAGVDAPFAVPNKLVDADALLALFCAPPNGLLAGWLPNTDPPKAVDAALPLVFAAPPLRPPNGLFADDAGEKSKPAAEGGWNAELWFAAPKLGAGNELVEKALLLDDGCAGGKLLVAAPKAFPAPNMPALPFSPMGADAPKLKLGWGCAAPKLTLCERPCGALAWHETRG